MLRRAVMLGVVLLWVGSVLAVEPGEILPANVRSTAQSRPQETDRRPNLRTMEAAAIDERKASLSQEGPMNKRSATTPRAQTKAKASAESTAEFDAEFVIDSFGAPPPGARAKWRQAKRKRGRPVEGAGAKVISVSVEKRLLARSDR